MNNPPLIPSDSTFTFGVFNNNVDIYGSLTATTATFPNLSATTSTITNLNVTNGTFNNISSTTISTTNLSTTNLTSTNINATNLTGLSQFNLNPFTNTQFAVTSVLLPGLSVYNNIYYSNTSAETHIKLPSSSSITSASTALQDNPESGSDFWIVANTGDIKLTENPPNVSFRFISGQTLTIPANNIGHFKIFSPSPGSYQVIPLGITNYV